MEIREAKKGVRVRLIESVHRRHLCPDGTMLIPRFSGHLRSGRILASRPPYEEGLFVYVVWDELRTPELWHLRDLAPLPEEAL